MLLKFKSIIYIHIEVILRFGEVSRFTRIASEMDSRKPSIKSVRLRRRPLQKLDCCDREHKLNGRPEKTVP